MVKIPIYEYHCEKCGFVFERIEKVSNSSYKENLLKKVSCPQCKKKAGKRTVVPFKIGSYILDTSNKSGYEDDDLTLGKLIDEGGIPAENQRQLRKREKRIKEVKKYTKGLKERGKKYGFDPFSADTEKKA